MQIIVTVNFLAAKIKNVLLTRQGCVFPTLMQK